MNQKLKIAFVTAGMPLGGSTIFLLHLAQGLRSVGTLSEIFNFTRENLLAADFVAAGIPVHTEDETKLIYEDRVAALYQRIADFKPSVVIANLGAEALEMLRYLPTGVTRIAMIHEKSMHNIPPPYAEHLDAIAVVNPSWAELVSQRMPGVRSRYLAHGIPLPDAGLVRSPNPAGPLRLIYFGRLVGSKGTRLFPAITKLLRQRAIPFHWAMYGNGPDEVWLREQFAGEIQAGEVTIAPHLPRSQLFRTIRDYDVFIMASENEGGPLTLLESMAVGLVPICNDTPCLAQEVINPQNGFIIPRDPVKYVEILSDLHEDRSRLERMSAAARSTMTARYSLEAMAKRYIEFITSIAPEAVVVSWPAGVDPKPIRTLPFLLQISQGNRLGRQARRIVKRFRR